MKPRKETRDQKAKLRELNDLMEEVKRRHHYNKLKYYEPTDKQREFHKAGLFYRQRMLRAGNQTGKTLGAAAEIAMHMTGLYPDDWVGHRFRRPTYGWAAGVTSESTRDNPQRLLLGRKRDWGSGMVPQQQLIGTPSLARGVTDGVDSFMVRHVPTGGVSVCWFKSYEKGREKWQGETLDWIWCDEEPPYDVYSEGLTRLNRRRGLMLITFTPLLGMTEVVHLFSHPAEDDKGAKERTVIQMTLDDATFYTPEERAAIEAQYGEAEREARVKGLPMLGEGLIYPVRDDEISIEPVSIPAHWPRIIGLDFGVDHPTAAVWLAYDPDTDILYLYDCYRERRLLVDQHARNIKKRSSRSYIPVAWPHDGLKTDPKSGTPIRDMYADEGLNMIDVSARYDDEIGGPQPREPVINNLLERMQTGRFKVFSHLRSWFEEKSMYHRKNGKVVPAYDDLISATHYAVMMLRYAQTETYGHALPRKAEDYDPLEY